MCVAVYREELLCVLPCVGKSYCVCCRVQGRVTVCVAVCREELLCVLPCVGKSHCVCCRVQGRVTVCVAVYREERQFNQTLRQEQDAAYLESLRADQEKVGGRLVTFFCKNSSCNLVLK